VKEWVMSKICISRICSTDSGESYVRWQVEEERIINDYGRSEWIVIDNFSEYDEMRKKYPHEKIFFSCECDYEDARNPLCMYIMSNK